MRLRRSGVGSPAILPLGLLSERAGEGLLARSMLAAAVDLGSSAARGKAVLATSDRVLQLVHEVKRAMLVARIKVIAFALVGAALCCGGAGTFAHQVYAESPSRSMPRTVRPGNQLTAASLPVLAVDDDAPTVKNSAPVVVRTEPQAGDTKVDAAAVKEIKVTFSKEMKDASWSWSQISKESFPEMTGKPHYDKDKRTCVLPVKLEAGKTYVLWLNPPRFQGFQDTEDHPAVFYPLVFETKP
jgi:RNA polymerase sigma-70 factor (ECF subfamily)